MSDLNTLSDEQLKAISEGRLDTLPDDVLSGIASKTPKQIVPRPVGGDRGFTEQTGRELTGETMQKAALAAGDLALTAGLPAAGQMIAGPVGGFIAGGVGDMLAQARQGVFLKPGRAFGNALVSALPGAGLFKKQAMQLGEEAAKIGLANLTAKTAETYLDEGRLPTPSETIISGGLSPALGIGGGKLLDRGENVASTVRKFGEDAPTRRVLGYAKELGIGIPPVVTNPSTSNRIAHTVAGGPDVVMAFRESNADAITDTVRKTLGFTPGNELSRESINAKIVGTNQVWNNIEKLGSDAAFAMNQYKDAMARGNDAVSFVARSGSGEARNAALAEARQSFADADGAAKTLKNVLSSKNADYLWDDFQKSRVYRAQLELARNSLDARGKIDPSIFGAAWDADVKLTGNLKKLGEIENAFSRYVATTQTTPSGSMFGGVTRFGPGALAGYTLGGTYGAVAGALTVPPIVRHTLMSKFGQKAFSTPFYGTKAPDFAAQMAKLGALSAGRQQQ